MSLAAFADGLLNPLTVPAHVLTWLSLGLLIGTQAAFTGFATRAEEHKDGFGACHVPARGARG